MKMLAKDNLLFFIANVTRGFAAGLYSKILNQTVTELQNCLVLPAPHKRASRPAPDFTVYFIKNKTIIVALVGNGFLNK